MKRTLTTILGAVAACLPVLAWAHPGHDHGMSLHTELSYPWLGSEHLALLLVVVIGAVSLARAYTRR